MIDLAPLIDNVLERPAGVGYAAILGANPSKGARSPKLWNAAFRKLGLVSTMLPLDVTAGRLSGLLSALDDDPDFMGGAIAVPHKEAVARWLGKRLTPEAERIGAVNCLFRDGGHLWGTNTDGEAARVSLEGRTGSLASKRVLLLGPGGAGKAVAAYLVERCAALTLAGRDSSRIGSFAGRIGALWTKWEEIPSALPITDILVNCTSIGSAAAHTAERSPVSAEELALLPPHAFVFDIIYDPSPTQLLRMASKRDLATLDGSEMNLEQAVLAFGRAVSRSDPRAVRAAMDEARQ